MDDVVAVLRAHQGRMQMARLKAQFQVRAREPGRAGGGPRGAAPALCVCWISLAPLFVLLPAVLRASFVFLWDQSSHFLDQSSHFYTNVPFRIKRPPSRITPFSILLHSDSALWLPPCHSFPHHSFPLHPGSAQGRCRRFRSAEGHPQACGAYGEGGGGHVSGSQGGVRCKVNLDLGRRVGRMEKVAEGSSWCSRRSMLLNRSRSGWGGAGV